MAVFSNSDHGFYVTGMTTSDVLVEITLVSYSGPTAASRYFFDGRYPSNDGASYLYSTSGNNLLQTGNVSSIELDGSPISSLATADITGGNVLSFVTTGHGGDIVIANRYSLTEPVNCEISAVTVKSADGTTTLHTFDLSSPSSTSVPDTTGSATGELLNFTFGSGPSITDIDTDNSVDQYQQAIVNVSAFTETITSVTFGGVACTIPENDPTDDQITVGVPGSLTTGTYDLVISGATETDTLTGVSYTQTHARPAFDGLVDSNSILSGQSYTANTYFRFVTSFSNGTLDTAAGDAAEWAGDIADYYTPNEGFTGDDTASIEFLYSDGTTSATVGVTINVPDTLKPAIDSVDVPTAGTYHVGQSLTFTTNWNEVVDVTGVPALNLDLGGSARQANYVSGTGTAALVFTYTVQSGDVDEDGIAVVSLTLDGGTIKDGAGNDAYLTLSSVGDTAGVLIDGLPIAVASVSVPTAGTYSQGNDLGFTVNFESAVDVTGTPELVLDIGGEVRAADYVSGNGTSVLLFRYTVVSGDADADGVGVSSLILAGGTIKDAYGVSADLTLNGVGDTSGVLVDGVGPAISISPLTTLDTTPIVSGSAGDAVSLTLVVNGVTYNPTPSGGTWSQQLNELAIGDYTMTLTGDDSNGNTSERTATLSVVDELSNANNILQPVLAPILSPILEDVA